jgi:hypothetical protein
MQCSAKRIHNASKTKSPCNNSRAFYLTATAKWLGQRGWAPLPDLASISIAKSACFTKRLLPTISQQLQLFLWLQLLAKYSRFAQRTQVGFAPLFVFFLRNAACRQSFPQLLGYFVVGLVLFAFHNAPNLLVLATQQRF